MKTNLRPFVTLAAALGASAFSLQAAPLSFDFKDAKGVNNVIFKLDAPLESINGTGTGISGTIVFDPVNPGATTGRIDIDATKLSVGNSTMQDHMQGEMWLDVKNHPTIRFEAGKLANVKTDGAKTTADVTGKLTVKGVTKEITVPVSFTHLPGRLGERMPKAKGDLLVVRTAFTIKRSDYGINAGKMDDKVAETIELSLSIAGAAPTA